MPVPIEPDRPHPGPDANAKNDERPVVPMPHEVVPPTLVAVAPLPRPVTPDFLGSQILPKLPPFDRIEVRVPFLRTAAELEREDVRQELAGELGQGDLAFRIDLFVRDTTRGVEVFERAAKAAKLKLYVDAATQEKLKKKLVHSAAIYTESLSPAELASLFTRLTAEDKNFSPRVCDTLHVTPAGRADELDLKALLGMDPGLFKRPAAKPDGAGQGRADSKGNPDDPRPVSDGTIDMVTNALTKPKAKPGEKSAVVLTWSTTHPAVGRTNPAGSKELQQFLKTRGDRKPDAVPVIIVIRPAG